MGIDFGGLAAFVSEKILNIPEVSSRMHQITTSIAHFKLYAYSHSIQTESSLPNPDNG